MNDLFPSLSPTVLALALAIVTGGALLVLVGLALNNPLLWRMGLRNTIRRPGQALLLLAGLVLSTMVITASFGLQDSYTHSVMNQRLAEMGNVDETVTGTFTQTSVDTALARIRQLPEVQAAMGMIFHHGTTITSAQSGLSIPDTLLYAVPADFSQVYGALLAVALGYGATGIEMLLLNHLPQRAPGEVGNSTPVSIVGTTLQPWLSWQSLLSSWCLGVLAVLVIVWITALWVSHINIVTAMRNLDDPPPVRRPLRALFQTMVPLEPTAQGHSATQPFSRVIGALGGLLWGIFVRGPLGVLMEGALFVLSTTQHQSWLQLLGVAFLLGGCGFMLSWLLPFVKLPEAGA